MRRAEKEDGEVVGLEHLFDGTTWSLVLGEDWFVVEEKAELVKVEGAEDDGADEEHRLVVEPLEGAERRMWATNDSWPGLAVKLGRVGELLGGKPLAEAFVFAPDDDRNYYHFNWTAYQQDGEWLGKPPEEVL